MTATFIFLAVGMCLLAILFAAFLLREQPATSTPPEGERNWESLTILTALELRLPSRLLADRIFAQEDWQFVSKEAPLFERTFLRERKTVALLWMKETRACMARLFHLHRSVVRGTANLNVKLELQVFANYGLFLFMSAIAQALIHLLGPFRVRIVIRRVFDTGDQVSFAVGGMLAALEPSLLAKIKEERSPQSNPAV